MKPPTGLVALGTLALAGWCGCVEVPAPPRGDAITPAPAPAAVRVVAPATPVALWAGGELVALGELSVGDGSADLRLYGPDLPGGTTRSSGKLSAKGELVIPRLRVSPDGDATPLKGRIRGRAVDATLTIAGKPAALRGMVANAPHRRARTTTEFDGTYELGLIDTQGVEIAAVPCFVELGKVRVDVVLSKQEPPIRLAGYVTDDGTLVLDDGDADAPRPFVVQATIDQDTFELRGVYRDGSGSGRVVGRGGD